jgi:hypothetical protein
MSNEVKLAAGTIVSFSLNLAAPAYTVIPKIMNIGAIGLMSEAKETTTLSDTNKTYGAGLQDAPDKSIKGQYIGSDDDQKAFRDAAKLNQSMIIKIEFPDKPNDAGTGTTGTFIIKTLGFEMDEPTGEEWLMFTVNAKQNTAVTWSEPVTG